MIVKLNSPDKLTDLEALQSKEQFKLIFQRHAGKLYNKATYYVDKDDAKDIVQDLMVETWNKRFSIRGNEKGSIENYLFIRLKFMILDFYGKKPKNVLLEDALPELIKLSLNNTYDFSIVNELKKIIEESMNEMKPSEVEAFKLRFLKQYSVEETAKSLGVAPKTVINRLSESMKTVRKNVIEYYGEESATGYTVSLLLILITNKIMIF
ncbi:MAG: sigma-70 family RNA polymerase sigma factor [Tissierellia bacterium]|nr:sigma-70 family RNA polymerase sigma factor [Tissierellia bacterium]